MLDKPTRPHVLTIGDWGKGFGAGRRCWCTCGRTFPSKREATEHWKEMRYFVPPRPDPYENWNMSMEAIPPEVQNVDMFPRVEFHWDRYTDKMYPINPAAWDLQRDWRCVN